MRALTEGRNGKGSIVVCAAGNEANRVTGQYSDVKFPADIPGVIAVGSVDQNGIIQNYSPRSNDNGNPITVVAPSGNLFYEDDYFHIITQYGDIWSLDIPGQPGYNPGNYEIGPPQNYWQYVSSTPIGDPYPPGNYTAHFGGTSASCPQVAGICALILSINSELSESDVINIIEQSATYYELPGPNPDYGYGRINAYNALKYTLEHYGGIITQNAILPVDTYDLCANLTIASGATLTIQPNTILHFASGTFLTINGTLIASGTSSFPVTFNFTSPNSSTQNGIKFNSGSSGNLNYCNVQNAYRGIGCWNNMPTISNCNITNNTTGLYLSGITTNTSQPVQYNTINNNTSFGIYLYNSYPGFMTTK